MRITGAGNVGIGTTSPDAALTINRDSQNFTALKLTRSGTSPGSLSFDVQTSGTSILAAGAQLQFKAGTSNNISFFDGSDTNVVIQGSTGNVGIGTTSPWKKLSVTGTVGFDGLTAGAGAGSLCLTANKEVVYSDNAGCTGSSLRFKHDIATLDATSGIEEAMKLRPVSFVYNDDIGVKGEQVGFIAEDVAQVDTRLVTYDASGTPNNVKYTNMVAIVIKAIQELAQKVYGLADTVAGFAERFVTKELVAVNGNFEKVSTIELCVEDVCVTKSQLAAVLAATGQSSAPAQSSSASSGSPSAPAANDNATGTPPTITIAGENPAHIHVGDTYNDLGATITGPQSALNFGIHTFLNGALVSTIVLDTSAPATSTIDYVATDQNGLTSTSTRTVIVEAANSTPSTPPEPDTATTEATSTAQ